MMSESLLFQDDSYARSCSARIVRLHADGEAELDRTVFFARSGGQQGDIGHWSSGVASACITDTLYSPERKIVHRFTTEEEGVFVEGREVETEIDWQRRYRMMRLHSALHLLCSIVPHGVSGGNIAPERARLDFDCGTESPPERSFVQESLDRLIAEDRSITSRWIAEADLDSSLVRTLSVQPPRGSGRIRLVSIEGCDLQPCGGTHVKRTGEIAAISVGKIENKGRRNRRITLHLPS